TPNLQIHHFGETRGRRNNSRPLRLQDSFFFVPNCTDFSRFKASQAHQKMARPKGAVAIRERRTSCAHCEKSKHSARLSKVRSKNTKLDLAMGSLLKNAGFKFLRYPRLPGHPDFLVDSDVVLFCDSA